MQETFDVQAELAALEEEAHNIQNRRNAIKAKGQEQAKSVLSKLIPLYPEIALEYMPKAVAVKGAAFGGGKTPKVIEDWFRSVTAGDTKTSETEFNQRLMASTMKDNAKATYARYKAWYVRVIEKAKLDALVKANNAAERNN